MPNKKHSNDCHCIQPKQHIHGCSGSEIVVKQIFNLDHRLYVVCKAPVEIGHTFIEISLNCDGVVLQIYLDHKFQWPQKGLNCKSNSLGHKAYYVRLIRSIRFCYLTTEVADLCWDTSTCSQVSNCIGVMLQIYLAVL